MTNNTGCVIKMNINERMIMRHGAERVIFRAGRGAEWEREADCV